MKRLLSVSLLLVISVLVSAAAARPRPEIMGISLDMKRDDAVARLKTIGSLEREARKLQEVWAVKDADCAHGWSTHSLSGSGGSEISAAQRDFR